jgi:ATP-dependent DNA helicase RecG
VSTTIEQLEGWMEADSEDEHLEFKEAKTQIDSHELARYCVALANEGGGKLILGVTNARPRMVVGSRACRDLPRTRQRLLDQVRLRVEAEEVAHLAGRVVVFHVPSRPLGRAVSYEGAFWMRVGQSLVPMTWERLEQIRAEAVPDFSVEVLKGTDLTCLDANAMEEFRRLWVRKSGSQRLATYSGEQLLADAELMRDGRLTRAALILLGTPAALRHYQLGQAEVIFEYRVHEESTHYDDRETYHGGFLLYHDRLWEKINLRNEVDQFQEGLFRWDIRAFNERVVREALLNAITHPDYQHSGSIFVKQSARRLSVESPGGFPSGITVENILTEHNARSRLIAETLERCIPAVERSGQGVNAMFEQSIRESKPLPDYSRSDSYHVRVILQGQVQDEEFLRFFEQVGQETQREFSTHDFIVLDLARQGEPIPPGLRDRVPRLRGLGLLEKTGYGKGTRYILSRRYYRAVGKRGAYTRAKGLDEETNKELLLKHIRDNQGDGSPLAELLEVLPTLPRRQVQRLLRELKEGGRVHLVGRGGSARWYADSGPKAPHSCTA